jgi:glycosyltransferase involved in cell wall biosynthesis
VRIAVIAPPWLPVPPVAYGGTELVLDTLCRGLAAAGHDVLLYTTGDSTCSVERAWTYERHLGLTQLSPADELRHVMDAYDAAQQWGADVVHDHTVTGPVWAQVHARIPAITTNHGPFGEPLRSIYRRVATTVPIVAISHHQASTAGDVPVRDVIHHGIDTDSIPVGRGDGGYALFLGRMNETKGPHRAIEIARAAGIPLKIAAKMREPAEHAYFDSCVKPWLGGDVEYLGEVGGPDKYALLGDAVCLLNPIAWPEPFGMVMVEALACGTPVVGTPCGAAPEIVDDGVTGFLRHDPGALATAVGAIDGLDRTTCRAVADSRFSMARMAGDHAAVYRALHTGDRVEAAELDQLLLRENWHDRGGDAAGELVPATG